MDEGWKTFLPTPSTSRPSCFHVSAGSCRSRRIAANSTTNANSTMSRAIMSSSTVMGNPGAIAKSSMSIAYMPSARSASRKTQWARGNANAVRTKLLRITRRKSRPLTAMTAFQEVFSRASGPMVVGPSSLAATSWPAGIAWAPST